MARGQIMILDFSRAPENAHESTYQFVLIETLPFVNEAISLQLLTTVLISCTRISLHFLKQLFHFLFWSGAGRAVLHHIEQVRVSFQSPSHIAELMPWPRKFRRTAFVIMSRLYTFHFFILLLYWPCNQKCELDALTTMAPENFDSWWVRYCLKYMSRNQTDQDWINNESFFLDSCQTTHGGRANNCRLL